MTHIPHIEGAYSNATGVGVQGRWEKDPLMSFMMRDLDGEITPACW
jgi:hypothetical protein